MEGDESRSEPLDELDALIRRFAESGHVPEGAAIGEGGGAVHGRDGHDGDIRSFVYRGHEVQIATHYEVMIDGERWDGNLAVRQDGTVTYHGLPQYALPSAVKLIEAVIDTTYESPEAVRDAIRAADEEE